MFTILPNTIINLHKILPKWRNLAESGHTDDDPYIAA